MSTPRAPSVEWSRVAPIPQLALTGFSVLRHLSELRPSRVSAVGQLGLVLFIAGSGLLQVAPL